MKWLKNFYPYLILGTLLLSSGSFANIFDEDDGNNLDQSSLNALGAELQEIEQNESYSQVYVPKNTTPSSLPTPQRNEWGEETQLAASDELDNESSDEIKRKEAAIMRDLEEHAKPIEDLSPSASPIEEKPAEEIQAPATKPGPKEFKPRVRSR